MEEIKKHEPGTFSWIDLGTTDLEAAKKFYTELFGLESLDTPAGPDSVYTMLNLNGKPVAALFEMNKKLQKLGMKPHWDSYVTVENVDEMAKRVEHLKGKIIHAPFDVFESGRMAIIQEPTGAVMALWQPKKDIGTGFKNIPGSLCWNELVTTDTEQAKKFLTELFGWGSQTSEMNNISYTSFLIGEKHIAGMYQMPEEMGDTPAHWLPYFTVEDCDKSCEKARELGAGILQPPKDIPGTGRFAVLQDPQGAVFAIIKMEEN